MRLNDVLHLIQLFLSRSLSHLGCCELCVSSLSLTISSHARTLLHPKEKQNRMKFHIPTKTKQNYSFFLSFSSIELAKSG